jgi:hypothetical protein
MRIRNPAPPDVYGTVLYSNVVDPHWFYLEQDPGSQMLIHTDPAPDPAPNLRSQKVEYST